MTWLVDANVLSEPTKPHPDAKALAWLRRHELDLAVDPIILGEVHFGVLRLPRGKKRQYLERWFQDVVGCIRCLSWDAAVGLRWSLLLVELQASGQTMPVKDSLIAASALHHGLMVATRNVGDFRKAGVKVFNPYA
jgi:predicted nucleic acid-binding protein